MREFRRKIHQIIRVLDFRFGRRKARYAAVSGEKTSTKRNIRGGAGQQRARSRISDSGKPQSIVKRSKVKGSRV
nr:MAG TPA: hypothetical protein [Caudoviricetes sp.]